MTDRTLVQPQSPAAVARRLLHASASHSYDPAADVDWAAPRPEGAWYLQPERLSLYGTPVWETMDAERRVELSRREMGSHVGMSTWFELCTIRMFAGYLEARDIRDPRTHYALTEIGDETRHLIMFGRLLREMGCPMYGPPPHLRRLFSLFSPTFQDLTTFSLILVIEEVLIRLQRETVRDERVQPLIREICRIHVTEEARHVSFARAEIHDAVRRASRRRLAYHRELTGFGACMALRALLHPSVYDGLCPDPAEARRQARRNPRFRESMLWSGEKLVSFLTEAGMITRAQHHWWRRAGLMP
ncbi:diiron oxygenase [Streptomyces sp. HPF1205]|uniref:AurF N-oxygenase family protein n=1 Tax=Streptomyces sp. HPF1205 TaxID=2873262 RepID=UPI001CEC73C1|nr:diiron oxygenase [Streptomyces sp. HPF1205]